MRSLCVFCGSSAGNDPAFACAAQAVGLEIVARGWSLVYGGGATGLMGVVADTVLAAGGEVIGVLPRGLARKELLHAGVARMHLVDSMHERKQLMAELSDGFLALPGGLGTFEELCEILTWSQLGIHAKPVALLDVARYYEPFRRLLDRATELGFIKTKYRGLLLEGDLPAPLLDRMAAWSPPPIERWMDRTAT